MTLRCSKLGSVGHLLGSTGHEPVSKVLLYVPPTHQTLTQETAPLLELNQKDLQLLSTPSTHCPLTSKLPPAPTTRPLTALGEAVSSTLRTLPSS